MAGRDLFVLFVVLFCLPLFALSCAGHHAKSGHHPEVDDDDDTSPVPDDDDGSPDDDSTPDDDDSSPDDDDSSPDDDDVSPDDDDSSPDDDDSTPDDDDTSPDDDDVSPDDDDDDNDDVTINVEYLSGGTFSGAAIAETPGGQVYIVSGKTRELRVYSEGVSDWPYVTAVFGVYANPSAALAPDGSLHLAYYDWFAQTLHYATNQGGSWADVLVDGTTDAGHYSAIVVGPDGVVHIAYDIESSRTPVGLRHASNAGGSWQFETVATGANLGSFPQIAVDGSNVLYVTFNNTSGTLSEVDVGSRGATSWQTQPLALSDPDGRASGLAAESNGTLHIIYHGSDFGLRYATGPYSALSSVGISGATNVADSISLALDANGVTHIAYADSVVGVMYGNNAGGTWTLQPLGSGYPVFIAANSVNDVAISIASLGAYRKNATGWTQTYFDYGFTADAPNLCGDSLGRLHFVYMEDATTTFWHAVGSGTSWSFEEIAATIGSGAEHFGIVADSSNAIHISYYNGLTFSLNYATDQSGSWVTSTIDNSPDVGRVSAIAIDPNGDLHVSYSDNTNGYLKYATNASGSWQTAIVDQTGLVGAWSDIAVDSSGVVYIGYTNQSLNSIMLAQGNLGAFTTQTVDTTGGNYVSIALDSLKQPQLAYIGAGLRHAGYTASGWTLETVDPNALPAGTAIRVTEGDALAIAYQLVGYELNLATGSAHDWIVRTIDGLDNVGQLPSLVAAANGSQYNLGYLGDAAIWLATVDVTGK